MTELVLAKDSTIVSKCLGPLSVAEVNTEAIEQMVAAEHSICIYAEDAVHSVETWEGKRWRRKHWQIGSVGFIPAGSELRSTPDRGYHETLIRFRGETFERAAAGIVPLDKLHLEFADITDASVFGFARSVRALGVVPEIQEWPLLVECAALSLAVSVIRKLAPDGSLPPLNQRHLLCDVRMRRVCEFVEANLSRRISLQDMADAALLSQYHFSRQFTQKSGITPLRYVLSRRVEMAKRAMAAPGSSIADVAYLCGFGGQSHFTTVFKSFTGVTPGEYRKSFSAQLLISA